MNEPASQGGSQPENGPLTRAREPMRRAPVVACVVVCFLIGLPLVSVRDGTILTIVGFMLELIAAVGLIRLIYLIASEGEESDPDPDPDEYGTLR